MRNKLQNRHEQGEGIHFQSFLIFSPVVPKIQSEGNFQGQPPMPPPFFFALCNLRLASTFATCKTEHPVSRVERCVSTHTHAVLSGPPGDAGPRVVSISWKVFTSKLRRCQQRHVVSFWYVSTSVALATHFPSLEVSRCTYYCVFKFRTNGESHYWPLGGFFF